MSDSIPFVLGSDPAGQPVGQPLRLTNRHGLIAGATGTGKTVTLQRLVENFSDAGVAVFATDIKGDLCGLGAAHLPQGQPAGPGRRCGAIHPNFRPGLATPSGDLGAAGRRGAVRRAGPAAGGSAASVTGQLGDFLQRTVQSAVRQAASQLGRQLVRGLLGSLRGGKR